MNDSSDRPTHAASTGLPVEALDYDLPEELIAVRPAEPRDSARLMVLHRGDDDLEHHHVRDLPGFLQRGDVLVFNNTAVLPARFEGRRTDSGGRVSGLYLHALPGGDWLVMLRSNGRLRPGMTVSLDDAAGAVSATELKLIEQQGGQWTVRVTPENDPHRVLGALGRTPLPPYILRARSHRHATAEQDPFDDALDRRWYQTVFADPDRAQSVAAPTAGLHFTAELLDALADVGVERIDLTLHVGPGTFKPITTPTVEQHPMHCEWYEVSAAALEVLRDALAENRRILAVGTTAVRTLESLPDPLPDPAAGAVTGETDLLIAPGYRFRHVHGMVTNFHLPRSTLLALVGAFIGLDRVHAVYREAISRGYRFYSYGDAMLILP